MKNHCDLFWQLFLDTGDPLCWMLFRRGGEKPDAERKGAAPAAGKPFR